MGQWWRRCPRKNKVHHGFPGKTDDDSSSGAGPPSPPDVRPPPPGRRRCGYGGCPVVLRYCSHGDRPPWEQYRSSAGAVPSLPAAGPGVAGDYRTLEGRLAGTARTQQCPKCGQSAGCESGGTPGSGRRGIMTLCCVCVGHPSCAGGSRR
jgi:hypothetical protein